MPPTARCNHTGGSLLRSFFLSGRLFPDICVVPSLTFCNSCSDWTFSVRPTLATLFITATWTLFLYLSRPPHLSLLCTWAPHAKYILCLVMLKESVLSSSSLELLLSLVLPLIRSRHEERGEHGLGSKKGGRDRKEKSRSCPIFCSFRQ